MKKILAVFAAVCIIIPLAACSMDGGEVHRFLNNLAEALGQSQITDDKHLIGSRFPDEDAYTGRYQADCDGDTGRDVVFGGGSIQLRKIHLYGTIKNDSGSAVIRIRQNEEVTELEPRADGNFETDIACASGGNYIMVDYKNFRGHVELRAEYEATALK